MEAITVTSVQLLITSCFFLHSDHNPGARPRITKKKRCAQCFCFVVCYFGLLPMLTTELVCERIKPEM